MADAFRPPKVDRQVGFHQLLVGARKNWLLPALRDCLKTIEPNVVTQELALFATSEARQVLAAAGIRDEFVFPTPSVLRKGPQLVGYYRLLLGRSQKAFYGPDGFAVMKSMELSAALSPKQDALIEDFCSALGAALSEFVLRITPTITMTDLAELPVLTIGSQFQGAFNNVIGAQATRQVWLAILELVPSDMIEAKGETSATVRNSAGRLVVMQLASDPDVRIREDVGEGKLQNKVAIEIKGGTDKSNAYNRAGEAEKSHLKAKKSGFQDCWTVISVEGVDVDRLGSDSPSTSVWFDISQLLARDGSSWTEFTKRIAVALGIPLGSH